MHQAARCRLHCRSLLVPLSLALLTAASGLHPALAIPQTRDSSRSEVVPGAHQITHLPADTAALDHALRQNDVQTVTHLLAKGADPDGYYRGVPVLIIACWYSPRSVRLLLDRGAQVNIPNRQGGRADGRTPLMYAWSLDVARLLIQRGANVNARDVRGCTPLQTMMINPRSNDELCRKLSVLLIAHGANLRLQDADGDTPLHQAVGAGKVAAARVFLQHGAAVNLRNYAGLTPLGIALCLVATTPEQECYVQARVNFAMLRLLRAHGAHR